MKINKMVMAIFVRPKRKLVRVLPELVYLVHTLELAAESSDPFTAIVHFFNAVSKWHDRGIKNIIAAFEKVNYGQYDKAVENLRALQKHFDGRILRKFQPQ